MANEGKPSRHQALRPGTWVYRALTVTSFPWIAVPTAIGLLACFGYWVYVMLAA